MQTSYTVTVRDSHCEGREYGSNRNCPLCAAIREQLPDFKLSYVGGNRLRDVDGNSYEFKAFFGEGAILELWNHKVVQMLKHGEISEQKVTFNLVGNHKAAPIQKPEVREKIRYVSVSPSITESTKELFTEEKAN